MSFKVGDLVEIKNPDRHAYYLEHGVIIACRKTVPSNEITYVVSFDEDTNDYFREKDLRLLEEVTTNKDSKISRVEQTHNNINEFLKKTGNRAQPTDASLSLIAQMLIEINETLAIICDKL